MDRTRRHYHTTAGYRQRVRRIGQLAPLVGALLQYATALELRVLLRLAPLLARAPRMFSVAYSQLSSHRRVWRIWRVYLTQPRSGRGLVKRLMDQTTPHSTASQSAQPEAAPVVSPNGAQPLAAQNAGQPKEPPKPARLILLVRHGQTTYNVEGRLPGQLPGVELTDEGRRQAQRAAVALSGLPLSAVIASPLERARETAEIIARGWALPVKLDERLMDTDMVPWAGRKIEEVNRTDPRWKAFVAHPTEPPEGVESLAAVQQRSVAAVEDILRDPSLGNYIVVVAHADVVKLIVARYSHVSSIDSIHHIAISNASISVLAFGEEAEPHLLAVNWTALPFWLFPPSQSASALEPQQVATPTQRTADHEETMVQAPGGVEIPERSLEEPAQSTQEEHPQQENVSPT
jgi:broad specificity phosphatase PhoE